MKPIYLSLIGFIFTTTCIGLNYFSFLAPEPALAVQLRDGTVAFAKSPLLLDFVTTQNNVLSWSARYYVTIFIPEEAGENLSEVAIEEREGSERIVFLENKTFAFQGVKKRNNNPYLLQLVLMKKTGE